MDVRFPNPPVIDICDRDDVGDLWQAARAAGVKPGTIRVWVTRRKIEPLALGDDGIDLYHLPTVIDASKVRPGRPVIAA